VRLAGKQTKGTCIRKTRATEVDEGKARWMESALLSGRKGTECYEEKERVVAGQWNCDRRSMDEG
jgi:hypothetical protein